MRAHGDRAPRARDMSLPSVSDTVAAVRERNRRHVENRAARMRRIRAKGFWLPCRICGQWRHLHQAPSPSMVARAWGRSCKPCARDTRGGYGLRGKNRQMVTGRAYWPGMEAPVAR